MAPDDPLVGRRIGPYVIQSRLGAGGMGRVYRARDAKLERDVAIKVLPDGVAADPERLSRFARESPSSYLFRKRVSTSNLHRLPVPR